MNNLFQTIKSSRAIIVLFIVYVLITLLVVTLNASSNKDSSKKKTTDNSTKENITDNSSTNKKVDENLQSFYNSVESLYSSIKTYVNENNLSTNSCIPIALLDNSNGVSGSVLIVDSNEYKVWYSNNSYVLNGVTLTSGSISDSDIDYSFSSPNYNKCNIE